MPSTSHDGDSRFWEAVGAAFPSLRAAASTRYYAECQQTILESHLAPLSGRLLLKTDLWDEAKSTEVLRWAAERGAKPVGIDIALSVARAARPALDGHAPGCVVADVRALPFRASSFDLIYSMGTIEHSPDYAVAVRELFRVLRPRGAGIVGVPNALDPFLRPAMIALLRWVGRYPYGMELSFTSGGLRRLLEAAGFRVTGTTGVLFMPGWLRLADLWLHVRASRLARLTAGLTRPFAWGYRRFPFLRRHGYLVACVVEKPGGADEDGEGP
jgi:SAM-dependent methyltransferase